MTMTAADELKHRANLLGPWHRIYVSRSGVRFGNGHVPIDLDVMKTNWNRECIKKLGGSAKTVVDLGSYEGYHALRLAEMPGVERVIGLEGRARNVGKSNLVNEVLGYDTVKFYLYDLEQIGRTPLPEPGPFDLVFCSGLIYHLTKPWEMVEWMSANCAKYLFLDTHYAALPLYRCASYMGEIYPEQGSETCGMRNYSFWPQLGYVFLMLMQYNFVPRFSYRFSAGSRFYPRVWIFAEKAESSAELNGINPLDHEAREVIPPLSAGPQPSEFNALEGPSILIKSGAASAVDASSAAVAAAEAAAAEATAKAETAELKAIEAATELQKTLASRSWKLTAPLRTLNASLAKLRK